MYVWLTMLVFATQSPVPVERSCAQTIFATGFAADSDADFDDWPDNWTRQRGEGFPRYLKIGIADDPAGETSRCLRVELDGGAATLYSPPIAIDPTYNYLLQGKLKTERLKYDEAYFSVTFYDSQRQSTESCNSTKFTVAPAWQDVQIGPLTPAIADARVAVIGLHVRPKDRSDLQGAVMFDDIRFSQLPRMSISSQQPHNLFFDPEQVKIRCSVSGVSQSKPRLHLELLDVAGRRVDAATVPLGQSVSDGGGDGMASDVSGSPLPQDAGPGGAADELTWCPQVPAYGFYTVRAAFEQDGQVALQHAVSLVVMRPGTAHGKSDFGWSLSRRDTPLAPQALVALLQQARVGWLKYPAWCDATDTGALDELAALADRLNASGIELVGVLDSAPASVREQFGRKAQLTITDIFQRPEIWPGSLEPILARLSLKIRHWQIGSDADGSLMESEGFESLIRDVGTHLKQSGQVMRLGLAWRWLYEVPVVADPPWDFLAMSESLPFTNTELERYATAAASPGRPYWITIQPLSKATYGPELRARDLVLRMMAAKVQGTPAIFVGDPLDDTRGLLNQDGTPTELFLPWRITADLMSGATHLGSVQLPNGSPNHLFARDGKAILVVWNDTPVSETLYLGDEVRQTNLWGEEGDLPSSDEQGAVTQTVTAGPLPIFLTGLNLAVARWRLNCLFEPDQLASASGSQQVAQFRFRNTFPDSVSGSVTLQVPDTWQTRRDTLDFQLANNEELAQEQDVLLRAEANSGPQRVRLDFAVQADQEYRFSVWRDVRVGTGEIALALSCWLDDSGQLVVEQQLENNSTRPASFNCYLYAPGRRRLREQVLDAGPGRVASTFALPNGQELLGKTLWLRAEEIGGTRLLNYRVVAEP